jgi:tetratricopeptide (TPR) repeat protein
MIARRLLIALVLVASSGAAAPRLVAAQADLVTRARKLDAAGDQAGAMALYRQALARSPKSFDAHYGLARALDLAGRYAEARQHFSQAIALAPDDGSRDQAARMMGVSWIFSGSTRDAAPYFQQVFDRRSRDGDLAGASEEANELGRVLLESGDLDGALRWYDIGYKTALRQTGAARDENLAEFRWAHAQARIAIRRGRRPDARRFADRARTLLGQRKTTDQQVQYPYLTGYVAFYSGDYRQAIADLGRADQQDPFILLLMAQSYEHLGRPEEARGVYRKVLTSTSHAINNAFARPVALRKLAGK